MKSKGSWWTSFYVKWLHKLGILNSLSNKIQLPVKVHNKKNNKNKNNNTSTKSFGFFHLINILKLMEIDFSVWPVQLWKQTLYEYVNM